MAVGSPYVPTGLPSFGGQQPLVGEILGSRCGVPQDAIDRALNRQLEEGGGLLGEILVRLKLADEAQLA